MPTPEFRPEDLEWVMSPTERLNCLVGVYRLDLPDEEAEEALVETLDSMRTPEEMFDDVWNLYCRFADEWYEEFEKEDIDRQFEEIADSIHRGYYLNPVEAIFTYLRTRASVHAKSGSFKRVILGFRTSLE